MKKRVFTVIALIAVFALVLSGCGKDETPAESQNLPATGELGLSDWSLSALAWSSSNGATVKLSAVPNYYADGMSAQFVIRVEGEDVERIDCQWDGKAFTAEADLNAEDGLCYYVVLSHDGQEQQVEVNTPANPTDELLINMAHALEAYCHMTVTDFTFSGNKLTVVQGDAQVGLPQITQDGQPAQCKKAELVLAYNEEEVSRTEMTLPAQVSQVEVADVSFDVPAMQDDEQLQLSLEITLADGQVLTAPGCTWFYNGGQLLAAVG